MDAWVASGLAALTGRADGPALVPPSAAAVVALAGEHLPMLGERAALAGSSRQGSTSCGGGTRLVATADGWLALNLARPQDVELLPAWLGTDDVASAVAERSAADVVAAGAALGLAVAVVGETPPGEPVVRHRLGEAPRLDRPPLVVDLSALWAGPLCSHLLQLDGARVVKVESRARPDGGRADTTGFYDLLNHGKASVALDLPSTYGLAQLRRLLAVADVVIEGSRPRALRQWGIEPDGPQVWVSITGHGRDAAPDRVAFGDDAAAAAGLVAWDDDGPCFLADAVADPLTGIVAAAAVRTALADGGRWLLDVALARVAASVGADREPATLVVDAPRPTARPVPGPAAELGADTDTVLAGLT
jgi:hypothetical protein